MSAPAPLPIDDRLPEIVARVREHRALVLIAPPGAGKTTRVAPAILDDDRGTASSNSPPVGAVLLLQPRRIAAIGAADRIAAERAWRLGGEVGYRVRFERKASGDTRLLVMTEGILIRRLQNDPFLDGVSTVILDEFHERSVHADLALALLDEIRRTRDNLRVVVMSATLDPRPISRFLDDCPVVETSGRPHPVDIRHATRPVPLDRSAEIAAAVADSLRELWRESNGHVLVFLPGIAAIRASERELERFAREHGARVHVLHGSMSLDAQREALRPVTQRKILLATNIAETSLTIDGVDAVIDTGLARSLRHDPRSGIDRLETGRISRHSAEQRAGRAGRQVPGIAARLWTRAQHATLDESDAPEVSRVDLASVVLELKSWGTADLTTFRWLEPPDTSSLARAESLLGQLGALAGDGSLTAIGRELVSLPVHPRIGRLLLAARSAGRLEDGALLAALLEERDIVLAASRDAIGAFPISASSDLLLRLELYREAERARFDRDRVRALGLDRSALRAVERVKKSLVRSLGRGATSHGGRSDDDLLRALLVAYPDRIARRREPAPGERGRARSIRARMTGGGGVVLARESVVTDCELFVAVVVDHSAPTHRGESRVHLASRVARAWIEDDLADDVTERVETVFDETTGRVRSSARVFYRDLPLEDGRPCPPPREEAEALLREAIVEHGEAIVREDARARGILARLRFLRRARPEIGLSEFDAKSVAESLAPACAGASSLDDVRRHDLAALLLAPLDHEQFRALDRDAPETFQVPSGSRIRIDYEADPPVLAARVQELFGLRETPRLAAGRVALLLHILGPNHRPVQVTSDLESFWSTTYHQVRKDLRGRYPKHAWPEDPSSARAETRPARRNSRKTR